MSEPTRTDAPALSDAARALLSQRAGLRTETAPKARTGPESSPLSTPQLGQWLSGVAGAAGSLPKTLRLTGTLDVPALARALTELVRRHEVLRTVLTWSEAEPTQRVNPSTRVDVREVDVRQVPAPERSAAAREALDADARRPFDLQRDLLLRPLLVRIAEDGWELQVTFQHIAFDGWSNGVFLRELGELYSAFATGRTSPLPELPLQYADFATWERAREGTPAFLAEQRYWQSEVDGSTSALDLATARARSEPRTRSRAEAHVAIDRALTERLRQLALDERTTLFAVTFAAFQVLVGRRAGLEDFVIGAVSANRTHRDTEGLIGSFMTILPLRARLDDAPSFRNLLRRTSERLSRGMAHQGYPFLRLAEKLRPGADHGAEPLFDVLFNYRNMPLALPALPGLVASDFRAPHLGTSVDFHCNLVPSDEGIAVDLEYNPDRFEAATAERWLEGFHAVLTAVTEDPDASIATLPVMGESERRLLADQWSGASVPGPVVEPVIAAFERAAAAWPDTRAIEHHDRARTYAQLAAAVRHCAARLRCHGVRPGDLVGLHADRSIDYVTAMLGILSAGGVYVPLDPRTPARRLDAMLADAGLGMIVADRPEAAELLGRSEPIRRLEELLAAPASLEQATGPRAGSNDPAYVIFTSGSTGVPKGVLVPHGPLARYIAATAQLFAAGPGDRHIQFGSLTFDVSFREFFVPLTTGGTVVLRPDSMAESTADFVEQSRALRLTHIGMPATLWAELSRTEFSGGIDLGESARVLTFGGEAAPADSVPRFRRACARPIRLFNAYGPTETTIACARAELQDDDAELPIGVPLPGVTAYVLDPRGQPVPVGVPGELWIGGENLAIGYLSAPALTAERFVPDRFSGNPAARLYGTGDIVRWRGDGQLIFLGRRDNQVKVRGYRVELEDVERVLWKLPGVRQAAVVHHDDRLVAFLTPAEGARLTPEAARTVTELELPRHLVPSQFVILDRLPLSVAGKVDRGQLKQAVPAAPTSGHAGATTPTEQLVTRVWEAVLGVQRIGLDDRFLRLGGHSILAMRIANRLRSELGVHIPLPTLFGHPTVRTLAREIDRLVSQATAAPG